MVYTQVIVGACVGAAGGREGGREGRSQDAYMKTYLNCSKLTGQGVMSQSFDCSGGAWLGLHPVLTCCCECIPPHPPSHR